MNPILTVILISLIPIKLYASASYLVSPTGIRLDYKPVLAGLLSVSNKSSTDSITLRPKIDANSKSSLPIKGKESLQQQYTLGKYMVISPRVLKVSPSKSRILRYRIKVPNDVPNGTYFTRLRLNMQPPKENPINNSQPQKAIGITLIPLLDTIIPIRVTKGTPNYTTPPLVTCQYKANKITVILKNDSEWFRAVKLDLGESAEQKIIQIGIYPYSYRTYSSTVQEEPKTITWSFIHHSPDKTYIVNCVDNA